MTPEQQYVLDRAFPDSNGCWIWMRTRHPFGYGIGKSPGEETSLLAHRISYRAFIGDPGKLWVCHTCDNPPCVNPKHLFLGTAADNSADMRAKGRSPRGNRQPKAKLSPEAVLDIRESYRKGATHRALATRYGVSASQIGRVCAGVRWAHVDGGLPIRRKPKLSDEQIAEMRERFGRGGVTFSDMATAYGCSISHAYKAIKGTLRGRKPSGG